MRGQVIVGAVVALLAFTAPAGAQLPVGGGQNPPVPIPVPSGAPAAEPYGTDDYGGFRDVLPPGTNGLDNGGQLAAFLATGQRPAHNDDQLGMYRDLMYATPGLQARDIGRFYKDSTFGVKPDDVESTISPRSDVTIVRDKGFGVPHIYGSTHAGVMFGAGYAAAQDRLFFIDVLRHAGRAELSSFVGGAPGNRAMDAEQWALAPYTEADFQHQYDLGEQVYGAKGAALKADAAAYVDGINQYIAEARLDPSKMPGEYAAIGRPQGPDDWKVGDLFATASLVGGIFGKGGGQELAQVKLLRAFTKRFGQAKGRTLWRQFAAFEDPDAPTTVKGRRFPYQTPPKGRRVAGAEELPDPGSFKPLETAPSQQAPGSARAAAAADPGSAAAGILGGPGAFPDAMSNALLISAKNSADGKPLAVFGPQVAYFAPEILMEEDLHGPGIDARGAAFPGVNLYVQLGHGRDYAWSATSAGQDIIDTFAVPLCDATHYRFRGQCVAIESLDRTNSWSPNAADSTPAGSETLHAERTKLGLVAGRGTYKGKPVLYTMLRSTYMHEVDSAIGFSEFNNPDVIGGVSDFQHAAYDVGYTFNWFYIDSKHIGYFNSGNEPVRAKGTTGQLPMSSTKEWKQFNPDLNMASYVPFAQHPQVVDQPQITSWNNKQAPGFAGADSNLFSSVFRSQMLDKQIAMRMRHGAKMTLPKLIDAMETAGTVDLRGQEALPLALKVIGQTKDPALRRAVAALKAWAATGAHRIDRNKDGKYDDAQAIEIMDAWWPGLVQAMFRPVMGAPLLKALEQTYELDNTPNNHGDHLGSAYQTGFYGYVVKDLKRVLKRRVAQKYARGFCGRGNRSRCRRALLSSLRAALAQNPDKVYPADAKCKNAGDQVCRDEVSFRPLGAVTQPLTPWINRPTYQQAVEIGGAPLSGRKSSISEALPWSETSSPHFAARHEHADAEDVVGVLELLEGMRERLAGRFPVVPGEIAVVVHGSAAQLDMAAPYLPLVRRMTAPAARRYLVGWAGRRELHVLAPRVLAARASQVPGSKELNLLAPAALLSQLVVGANQPGLPPPWGPRTAPRYRRWAWLSAGAGQWLSGQVPHARAAIARRMREGPGPAFPPGPRDAGLLGGSVLDLLAREEGEDAVLSLLLDPLPRDPRRALIAAFHGRSLTHTEGTWRAHLSRLAGGPARR
ncbi:MAG: penicillin acylase family protein [Solirubrobacteraceae bacterium]